MKENRARPIKSYIILGLIIAGLFVLEAFFSFLVIPFFSWGANAQVGENATVITTLRVGAVYPEILNVTINPDGTSDGLDSLTLVPNATVPVNVFIIARDYNNESDILNISLEFYDLTSSSYGAGDDHNNHYTNSSCAINYSFGRGVGEDEYEVSANCTIGIWYNAFNSTWIGNVNVTDKANFDDINNDTVIVNTLIALEVPDTLDYGIVNATAISTESNVNVTNYGNVAFNLSLEGYASQEGDGLAMNCTLGATKNISIIYERYNLTMSNSTSPMDFTTFNTTYVGLRNDSVITTFSLNFNNDEADANNALNQTYWRIYVPRGAAGNCSGNIIFGAIR